MPKNQVIINFFKALQNGDVPSILSEGDLLLLYLKQYCGSYKPNGVLFKILMIHWEEKQIAERDKAIVQSLTNYISYYLVLINKNDEHLKAYINNIKVGLADFKPTICRLDKNIDFDFLLGSTNVQQTAIQYKIVEKLFYSNSLRQPISKYDLDHLVVPFLRTILESKIKGVLGIDILRNNKNHAIDLSEILDILQNLKSIKLDKAYNVNVLSIILKWLNHFMHRNLRPEAYILHQVLQYLNPIFQSGKIEHKEGILFSINSSAYANDLKAFHLEVEINLTSKFPGCHIQWKKEEVSSVKKKNT